MGVRFIEDHSKDTDAVAMYDSVSGWAFGPVFATIVEAEEFLYWLGGNDPRTLTPNELQAWWHSYQQQKAQS